MTLNTETTVSGQLVPTKRPWDGRFTDAELTNEAYHAAPGISKSHLDVMAEGSARHYWQKYINPSRPFSEPTDALRVGNAVHAAILQPALFDDRYAEWSGTDKRTKAGKEEWAAFQQNLGDRITLSHIEYTWCLEMRDAVHAHPIARGLLMNGKPEHSFFARDTESGELIKCRTDYFTDDGDVIVDIKTTTDAHPITFGKDAANYRYDLAPPWYFDVIGRVTGHAPRQWIWLVIEKSLPYAIGIYYAQKHDIIRARDTCRRNFLEILKYRQANLFPDYGDQIRPLELPGWIKR